MEVARRAGLIQRTGQAARPQFRSATSIFVVHPWAFRAPSIRALNDTTRAANRQSASVHFATGLAFSFASAGSRARVEAHDASLLRGFFDHARICAGVMFTSA